MQSQPLRTIYWCCPFMAKNGSISEIAINRIWYKSWSSARLEKDMQTMGSTSVYPAVCVRDIGDYEYLNKMRQRII